MTFFLQLAITGFSLGMIYALIALGFVIILKCSKAFNIAQGQFVMIGGYLGYTFLVTLHFPVWATLLAAIGSAVLMGLLIERVALRPLMGQSILAIIMMTIALGTILEGIATLVWGGEYKTFNGVLPSFKLQVSGVSIPPESLIGIIVSIITVIILMIIFRYTKIGLAMRATAENEQVVRTSGIKVTSVYAFSWIIACVVGVVSGILLGGVSGVTTGLADIGMKALAVVILGGLDSIEGAIIAGIILGVLENLASGYLDPLMPSGGGLANVFPFLVMIIVLIFKPYGLFGLKRIERI
jgi:branched-chain amino acid transport system permease protein